MKIRSHVIVIIIIIIIIDAGCGDRGTEVVAGADSEAEERDVIGWRHVANSNDATSLRQRLVTCLSSYLYWSSR